MGPSLDEMSLWARLGGCLWAGVALESGDQTKQRAVPGVGGPCLSS